MGTIARATKGLAGTALVAAMAAACGSGDTRARVPASVHETGGGVTVVTQAEKPATRSLGQHGAQPHHKRTGMLPTALSRAAVDTIASKGPGAVPAAGPAAGREATPVAGGIVSVPALVPTAFDPSTGAFKGACTEEWTGDWTGLSVCNVTDAHFDRSTGYVTARITDSFTGTYMGDHSKGTLTIAETFAGNLLTGSGFVEGQIVAGSGDPAFRCSSGSVTIPVFLDPAIAYGGYAGTWLHGCKTAHV